MRDFTCGRCGQRLSFENSECLNCGGLLGFHLPTRALLVSDQRRAIEMRGGAWHACANLSAARCNWLAEPAHALCRSCRLTRTRPNDADAAAMSAFADAETAKRRVIAQLDELGLPIVGRVERPADGLAFDLLSSSDAPVTTGHDNGVVTLDLAESNDVHREQLRVSMDEPYRTLVGHFRHEIGHYYQLVLVGDGPHRRRFDALFGDPDQDYQAALDRHYSAGPPTGWETEFVSSYATAHPTEDWAETFAHYLHIRDTLDTAAAFGMAPAEVRLTASASGVRGFDRLLACWLPLSWSLNQINRSMGHPDLYPFVLPAPALEKMRFVHTVVDGHRAGRRCLGRNRFRDLVGGRRAGARRAGTR